MDYTRLLGAAETTVPILVFLAYSLQRWKAGMREAWREEANEQRARADRFAEDVNEQRARADRLAEDVKSLLVEVTKLRAENAELRAQVAELLNR
ncbi:hypothetical protein ACGFLS_30710 [Streptomyces abikoensis]|uniref:hypothetical protein n=1 Tax=Streptomyces abikoensis TaxID=97398 RepID=UPI0037143994